MSHKQKYHPIEVVSRRTGLTQDVLRAWERRYKAISPRRSSGRHRQYTDKDLERLQLLRRATRGGRGISQVAGLTTMELRRLVEADESAAMTARVDPSSRAQRTVGASSGSGDLLEDCLAAVKGLDVELLEQVLGRASLEMGPVSVIDRILVPLMTEIGEAWADGRMRVVHEHLTSALVRTFLGNMARMNGRSPTAPSIVVATPAGQMHELGALTAVATAASSGWRCVYLGSNLPAEEIAAAVEWRSAKAVALELSYPGDDAGVVDELRRLDHLIQGTPIMVGGPTATSYAELPGLDALVPVADLKDFRARLDALSLRKRPSG